MVPLAILIGLLAGLAAGRLGWWAVGIVTVAWPLLMVATDADSGLAFFVGAAALAAVNTIIGFAVGIASRWLITAIVGQARSHA
jgi:hypothetical protein